MTIENTTTAAVEMFKKMGEPTKFFTDMFNDRGASNQEKIQMDVVRGEERVAVDVVPGTGPKESKKLQPYTSKEYITPAYDESYIMTAGELKTRLAGDNAFTPADINSRTATYFRDAMKDGQDRIDRAVEAQAVEVLTTGLLTFENNESLDFKPKSSHFTSASVPWSTVTASAVDDIDALAQEIRKDSLAVPDIIIMGSLAFKEFLRLNETKDAINFRRAKLIEITPPRPASAEKGAVFHGVWTVASYEYQIWTYPQYRVTSLDGVLPVTKVEYLNADKVVVMSSKARLDRFYGAIHRFSDGNVEGAQLVGLDNIMAPTSAVKTAPYVFLGNRGQALEVGVRSRPLVVPTDIDSFACLTI